jgi:hypothetical protein
MKEEEVHGSKVEKGSRVTVIQCGKVCICTLLTQGERVNPGVKKGENHMDYGHSSCLTPLDSV